ncbi:MAG TPA: hypothetical protein VG709_06100 [Actinomycetota bacterium]|nr:hypothetical protein [Actinomycetota bacterium]
MSPNTVLYALIFGAVGVMVFAVFYGDERGWGAGLTLGVSFGALIVAAIVYAIYESARKRRRREAAPMAAASLGLTAESAGGRPLPAMPPFELMSRGMGRSAENVMSGDVGDDDVWLFDYTFYTESTTYNSTTGTTSTSRHDHYFSCVLAALPGDAPAMTIGREGFFSKIARGLGFEDVELDDKDFDRRFKVKAADRDAAVAILDPVVRQWLMTSRDDVQYELSGRYLLAYAKQRDLDELRALLDAAVGFREQLRGALTSSAGG